MSDITLSLKEVHELATNCLLASGCDEPNAEAVAETIHAAERDGCSSHGLFRLPGYVASLKSGKVNGTAVPEIRRLSGSVIQANGNGGYAPLALQRSRSALIDAARGNGIAALVLVNVHHFAALWTEVEPVVKEGLVAMAFTTYKPAVVPAGASEALYGTNPMCFGWPRGDEPPLIFDQASSSMAKGEVMIAAREGQTVPSGTGIDSDGNDTTDPGRILDGGALLPFGGYKGSNMAMMIELLVAGLSGQDFSFEAEKNDNNDGGPPAGGELMLAMDPARFGDSEHWQDHSESFINRLGGMDGSHLPGTRRQERREVIALEGVKIPQALHEQCRAFMS